VQQLLQLELRGIALLKRGNPANPWTMVRPVISFTVNAPTLAILGPYRNMGVMISPPPRPRSPEKKPENIPTLKTKTDMFTP
jgi:hypothetical protein